MALTDKQLLAFLNREVNTVCVPLIVSRQETEKGVEYLTFRSPDELFLIHEAWQRVKDNSPPDKPPKHTGGKKPYLMLMLEEVERLCERDESGKRRVDNAEELLGWLVRLGRYIEWHTGRLRHKRSKKPLRYDDLLELYGCSRNKLDKMLGLMRKHDLLTHTSEGYFVSRRLLKRGKTQEGSDAQKDT